MHSYGIKYSIRTDGVKLKRQGFLGGYHTGGNFADVVGREALLKKRRPLGNQRFSWT